MPHMRRLQARNATMPKALAFLAILLLACALGARADTLWSSAPADEYFGPHGESVLEIRNRLTAIDSRDPRAMYDPGVASTLDELQRAILDWQHRYPRDSWLPKTLAHLVYEYRRAGLASSDRAQTTLALMRSAYPDAPETLQAVTMAYGTPAYEQPAPAYQLPAPYYQQPAPYYQQPAPYYEQPAPWVCGGNC
jgi:hypothetical protein